MSQNTKLITARVILAKTIDFFTAKEIPSARLDAEILLASVLDYDRLRLYMNLDRPMNETELDRARELVRRRAAFEPVAYILGRKEFAGRDFVVRPGVLIPRPDTEILVEEAARELRTRFENADQVYILEFGIGSGAISVSLMAEDNRVRVVATEINETAALTARENATAHGVADRLDIRLQPDFVNIDGPFHAIVSNPPYIDPADKSTLARDIIDHEPHEALFAENAGLHWYETLAAVASRMLLPDGFIAVEIGHNQRSAVENIFREHGLTIVRTVQDYGQNDRVIIGQP